MVSKILRYFLKAHSHQYIQIFTWLFIAALSLSLLFSACTPSNSGNSPSASTGSSSSKASVVRIGYQRFTDLDILKTQGNLEKRLKPDGVSVQWTFFQAGPPLLEAMNTGSIDFGGIGEVPPIFAQAAGAQVVYVGTKPPAPDTYGILVPKNSPIQNLAELKGKRVALVQGSSANYLIVQALKSAGLKFSDIKAAYLPPSDARAAFEQGGLDAWVVWDPFLTVAQQQLGARVLTTGQGGLGENRGFFLASRAFAEPNPNLIQIVLEELEKSEAWAKANPHKIAETYAPQLGLDVNTLETVARRRSYGVLPIDDGVLAKQQSIADTLFELKLIPKQLDVKKAAWKAA